MASGTEARVQQIISNLRSLDKARELFAELNYDPAHDLLSRSGWTKASADALAEDPQVMACHDDFKIIYARLNSDRLLLGDERPVVNRLLQEHPYLLCLFSDRQQQQWHFVNIKYDEDVKRRRLFRRITVGPDERLRTATESLSQLDLERIRPDLAGIYPLDIQQRHDEAFDVEVVTKEFYNTFVDLFHQLKDEIAVNNPTYRDEAPAEAQMLLNRLLFLYFIQKKQWLDNNLHYLYERFREHYAKDPSGHTFYSDFLIRLFQKLSNEELEFKDLGDVPFLNGGLFEIEPFHSKLPFDLKISNRTFRTVFERLLEHFNFTVREDTPVDVEVAIDPEMLGRIFENLILQMERDRDLRRMTGSYYTPRVIVHFMCQQSLREYLASESQIDPTKLEMLLELNPPDQLEDWQVDLLKDIVSIPEARTLRELAKRVFVLDPAVGSGAFIVGMLHEILALIKYMDVREHTLEHIARRNYDYELKRDIIENCLYGVDILEQAVRICELRLWLSLVVDYDREPREEVPPLPNLSYQVRKGDSLIETLFKQRMRLDTLTRTEKGRQLIDEIQQEKHAYFLTRNLKQKRQKELSILVKQCELAEVLVNEKKQYLATKPRLIGEMTVKEATEDEEIKQQAEALTALLSSAKNSRQKAQAWLEGKLSASSIDINKLSQQLGTSFVWRLDFAEVFKERDGFDIVIANPPYLSFGLRGAGKLSKADDSYLRANYPNSAEYKLSIYAIFIDRGIELLGKNGVLCYITPDSFLLGRFFSKLRRYVLGTCSIKKILAFTEDFWESGVVGRPVISLLQKESKEELRKTNELIAISCSDLRRMENRNLNANPCPQYYYEGLQHNRFRLFFSRRAMDIVEKMEKGPTKLLDCLSLASGLIGKKGQDDIISDTRTNRKWLPGLVSGKEMNRYEINYAGNFILFEQDRLHSGFKEAKYFESKLLLRQTGDTIIATYDDSGFLCLNNLHVGNLVNKDYDLLYILAILNSKLMKYYYHVISLELGRVMAQTDIETLEQLPIKPAPKDIQKDMAGIASDILRLHADYKYPVPDQQLTTLNNLESQLDRRVYGLYELSPEEVAHIEASL